MVYYHLGIFVPHALAVRAAQGYGGEYSFGADFYPIWLTSRESLRHPTDVYSAEMTRHIQTGLFGQPMNTTEPAAPLDYRAFAYPAFADILFWPVGLLPFAAVRLGLAVVLVAVTAASVVLWLRGMRMRAGPALIVSLTFLTLSSYAVLEGLYAEQLGLLVGFLLAASLGALAGRRLFLSGSLLALALIKPQMIALVTFYLLLWSLSQWRTRWRLLGGFLFVAFLLFGSSLLIWPGWIPQWLLIVFGYRRYSTPPLICYVLGGGIGSYVGLIFMVAVLAGAIALAWRMRSATPGSHEFSLAICLLLAVTTITLLPGHAVYDHVVLLPGVLLVALSWRDCAASSRIFRVILSLTGLALFWQWICAPIVVVVRPILSPQLFASTLLMLPIRTAASIPFGIAALLWLTIRENARRRI